ncbi:ankyrin repeat domain-containing protein [Mucilaginibacter aquariorum]|uniref:Ankyrin repeat domain-containing protein n=1 Tax=Mucilaginibacter aquariorum TaxID=2967225 RepID=A0ABT1T720_9SPHI|nr:ankyrin repeat domain-containing protein [Mucilaginibacter aquariorum]MCQ6960185.1 ankyrin repeat domain-containing protein [Mucilaginibacter aquariorum]
MDYLKKLITDIEIQSVTGIQECFDNGISPNDQFRGKPLIYEVLTEYPRGPKFKQCVKVFVDNGLQFEDKILLATLLDEAAWLNDQLKTEPQKINIRYSIDCAFTPLHDVTLLHICAEYNHINCAKILVEHGADINAKAGYDEHGFGGHTPIFHTVNQHANASVDVMDFLLSRSVDLEITVKGLIWGKGYDWETFIPSVNPISYAMMGLLPQFQRKEDLIYANVSKLLKAAYGIDYLPENVPNKYLNS